MTDEKNVRSDADGGWKDIIEDFTEEFFSFYFPKIHKAIDFSVPVEFLDTELRQITPDAEFGKRHADRLLKVRLKDGREQWLFIHIEVQGETRETPEQFAERMFMYYFRIYSSHGKSVLSLAVFTDGNTDFRPTEYRHEILGCKHVFTFPAVKLIDYPEDILQSSDSPFAIVTTISREYLAAGRDPEKRYNAKLALTRLLYRRGRNREQIIRLYRFLDFILRLPHDLALQYSRDLEAIEGELKMPYITQGEEIAKREGLAEGLAEGLTKGQLQGRREDVIEALEARFRQIPYELRESILRVDSDVQLKKLLRLAVTVNSLDEFTV